MTSVRHKFDHANLGPGGLVDALLNLAVEDVNVDALSTGTTNNNNN